MMTDLTNHERCAELPPNSQSPARDRASRVMLVEPDAETVAGLQTALGSLPCVAVKTLHELHQFDLDLFDLVLCAATLEDGSGLDALAYIRGLRADLPVIVTGQPEDLVLAVEAIRAGALDFIVIGRDHLATLPLTLEKCLAHQRIKQENERLHREMSGFLGELADKNLQLQTMINRLETMARTDELTGLCNRRRLNEMTERLWAEALRHDLPLACIMMDLDHFKTLNDAMGHQRGDELLRLAGRVIEANCRQVDVASRYGGDEFCILMPSTEAHEAAIVAQRILREFDHALGDAVSGEPRVSISIGISHISLSRPINAEQLIGHADEAMYAAKTAGKSAPGGRKPIMVRGAEGIVPHLPTRVN